MATSARDGKLKVFQVLEASLTGLPITATYGQMKTPPRQWAFVSHVTYVDTDWAAIGARKRTETYDVTVVFSVSAPGGNADSVEDLTLSYVDTFETALRANPSLDGLAAAGAALRPQSFKSMPYTDGFLCEWEGVVRVSGVRI